MQRPPQPIRRSSKASDSVVTYRDAESGHESSAPGSYDAEIHPVNELESIKREGSGTSIASLVGHHELRPRRSGDTDTDSHRVSFSSLHSLGSLGSMLYNGARNPAPSGPSSAAGSEPDGTFDPENLLSIECLSS